MIISGGRDDNNYYDDILQYDPEEGTTLTIGHMSQARVYHAVSVVPAQHYAQWCQ